MKKFKKENKIGISDYLDFYSSIYSKNINTCMHEACPECGGTGIKKNGLGQCFHGISCPCPKCTIR